MMEADPYLYEERFMSGLRARPLLLLAALGALGLAGCGKKGIAGELQLFKEGGRSVSEFSDLDPSALHAKKCQTGTIDNIAALLCEYDSPESATQGQTAAEEWFGETSTALVLRRERLLLALSDRSHIDANGKAMSTISKLFRRVSKR
jgi:hypothetical protein